MSFSLSEYTKIDVGWGFAPDLTEGAYSAPLSSPRPSIAGFKGAASPQEGIEGRIGDGEGRGNGEGRGVGE